MSVKISVKWGKEKYDLDLNVNEPPSVLKQQLCEKTSVLPDRQKIMFKGKLVKDDTDWKSLNVKAGDIFMMMGSAEKDIIQQPTEKTVFLEDLTSDQAVAMSKALFPSGLVNLGNTCYLNATIQSLNAIPELKQSLQLYKASSSTDLNSSLLLYMRRLFEGLSKKSGAPLRPVEFVNNLRRVFPQFDRQENGIHEQQDAEECLANLFGTLTQKVPKIASGEELKNLTNSSTLSPENSIVRQLFGIQTQAKFENQNVKEEPPTVKSEVLFKLSCHITGETNFMMEGIKQNLEEKVEKNGLDNQPAIYHKSTRLTQLPYYTIVHFVRFYWKNEKKLKAKIVRPVEFPFTLDVFELCSESLQKELIPSRKQLQQTEEEQKAAKKSKTEGKQEQQDIPEVKMTDVSSSQEVDPSKLVNKTGLYELFAVVSHKGRSADGGHYVGWTKESDNKWMKFDDENVEYVTDDEIKKLSGKGGGDYHIASLLFYRSKNPPL